ncbi:ATP-dependent Clp protease adapter ClpS [Cyanobacterium stanieri LEGE 03274]|uniref:ATP-dependent Clp protease adapter protein ClpS n=1 Tax=Cyanobacterium stanieri LEGE 03274 TaxID=1828756 RepID=A0ABR9V0U9_9CHRO|nr:ATP-dependent Clp protease adapter ClpS [Cyanobacterium stanieri]MBE9221502.1 ATP-dependent Clp protease adapter ClpS [Cyanobacterium stanieri LEGE 03274]
MSTQVINKPDTKSNTKRRHDPGYRVLLHNDSYNTMEYVVQVLMETVSLSEPQAVSVMMETHQNGIGLVTTCALEHAEFYCESLKSRGLTSTIEPAE